MWFFLALLLTAALAAVIWVWLLRERRLQSRLRQSQLDLADVKASRHLALAEEQNKQQTVFNSMVEGLLILDEDGRVQFANPTLGNLFDLRHDIRGQTLLEALRHHELKAVADRSLLEGRVTDFELTLAGPEPRVLQINAASFRDRDRAHAGTILVFHDLTRLKQLENLRKEFVANVSHELRTPLSLIKGYVETLIDGAKDDPAIALRFLQTIEKHADRLSFLIEDLLTISQLEAGQIVLNQQPILLAEQVGQVIRDLHARAQERTITLHNEVAPDLSVHADGDRFQQVLFNLVDNAVKYGRAGGTVRLGARSLGNGMVEGWVTDDGPGIPAGASERVFERFFRVDRARSRDAGGTGLGLSIVKHIVQSHGGEVRLETAPGRGCTFFYTLPADFQPA